MFGYDWRLWASVAALIAIVFAIPAVRTPAAQGLVGNIRLWGHSAVWVLLSASFALRWIGPGAAGAANAIALAAGGLYLLFLLTLFR